MQAPPPVIEKHEGVLVVREDLLEGGSKTRFLPGLVAPGTREVVFGGPFCGGAPWALSVWGRQNGVAVTLFYAKRDRSRWHRRQRAAEANGARIIEVPFGYMSNVQAKARRYCEETGASFLPLGFDVPAATSLFVAAMAGVRERIGVPGEIWCASGSGMLAKCLGLAFPSSRVCAVAVGLKSRWSAQSLPDNVSVLECPLRFDQTTKEEAPFPSCGHYDRKAWAECRKSTTRRRLFWNVAGD